MTRPWDSKVDSGSLISRRPGTVLVHMSRRRKCTIVISIPGLATWIFRDWLSPASKSRYGWKIAKSTLILKNNQPTLLWSRVARRPSVVRPSLTFSFSTSLKSPNGIDRKKDPNVLYQFCGFFFGPIWKTRWPSWPLIDGDTFTVTLDYIVAQQTKSSHWLLNI